MDETITAHWPGPGFADLISAFAGFTFVLVSPVAKNALGSRLFTFLGGISYPLYLVHMLIVYWSFWETIKWLMLTCGFDYYSAAYMCFAIYVPALLLIGWIGE